MSPRWLSALSLALLLAPAAPADEWAPADTYGVIVGVLRWPGHGLSPFSTFNRKDEELYDTLVRRGVPRDNLTLLLDERATLQGINAALREKLAQAKPGAAFVFYYAGHGTLLGEGGRVGLCNYDCGTKDDKNFLETAALVPLFREHYKGKRVLLLADCCHSGGLGETAEQLHKAGFEAVSLTSADRSNISTGNWTFTQTILDALNGDPFQDADGDGRVTLDETARELEGAMQFREFQRYGYHRHGVPAGWVLATTDTNRTVGKADGQPFAVKDYAWVKSGRGKRVGRLVGFSDGQFTVEFYDYSVCRAERVPPDRLEKVIFGRHKEGEDVQVEWGGKWWPGKILKVDGDFHRVTYPGWPSYWDEWVLSPRLKAPARTAEVEWNGQWYAAEVLKQEGGRYYITYAGYDSSWDEWVPPERVRFPGKKEPDTSEPENR